MYFPHAYQKLLLATQGFSKAAAAKTTAIAAAKLGIVDNATNLTVDMTAAVPAIGTLPMIRLAQGSTHTVDKLGNSFHGGYKEPVQSKGINPHYVTNFYKSVGKTAVSQVFEVKACANDLLLECATTYYLKLELKGSPALRFMNRNIYNDFDAYTGCCPAAPGAQTVKPWTVFEQWALGISQHEHYKPFVDIKLSYTWTTAGAVTTTTVVPVSGTSLKTLAAIEAARPAGFTTGTNTLATVKIVITGAYVDTKFGNCSFDPRDSFELEPIIAFGSIVDRSGDPCTTTGICTVEVTKAQQSSGSGESLLRQFNLHASYLQDEYQTDARLREVLDGNGGFTYLDRTKSDYTIYYIAHSVPRKGNHSSMKDADVYLLAIPVAAADADFETWFQGYLDLAGNGVKLETY